MAKTNSFSDRAGDGVTIVAALESLSFGQPTRVNKALSPTTPAPSIPNRSGTSLPIVKPASSGGGIASPLAETAYSARTWHAVKTITSSDGLLRLRVKPIKSVTFSDANGAEVVIAFKAPT